MDFNPDMPYQALCQAMDSEDDGCYSDEELDLLLLLAIMKRMRSMRVRIRLLFLRIESKKREHHKLLQACWTPPR